MSLFIYRIKINELNMLSIKFALNRTVMYAFFNLSNLKNMNDMNNKCVIKHGNNLTVYFGYHQLYELTLSFLSMCKQSYVDGFRGDFVASDKGFTYEVYPSNDIIFIKENIHNAQQLVYYVDNPNYIYSIVKNLYYKLDDYQKLYFKKLYNSYIQ